jgi:Tol biopolymer transport system component
LFVRNGALMAQELDVSKTEVQGEPFLVSDSIATDAPYSFGDFSVSNNGTLAFNSAVYQHEMIWLDRPGNRIGSGTPVDRYAHPTLAQDGKKAVFERSDPKTGFMNLWQFDAGNGALTLFENNSGGLAVFSQDGRSIAYACMVDRAPGLYRKTLGGVGHDEIWKSERLCAATGFSPDGRFLAYTEWSLQLANNLPQNWILPLTGDRRAYRFYPTDFHQFHGQFSPDGKWMAYTSNETGDFEVYVQPFPATGEISKISSHGGAQPRWRRDGREMFYRTSDGKLMAVQVKATPKFEAGVPHMLFQAGADPLYPNLGTGYDVTPDGQRFLINSTIDESRASPITIVMNWTVGMKR